MILTMKKITAIFAVSALAAVSCAKYEAPDPSITVTTDKTEYRAGEPVTFTFEGDPDNIVFYSGEYGHNYEDRHNYGRVGTLYFDFTSYSRYGTYIPGLEALVSTDFNGVYDLENVNKATWHELPAALQCGIIHGAPSFLTTARNRAGGWAVKIYFFIGTGAPPRRGGRPAGFSISCYRGRGNT